MAALVGVAAFGVASAAEAQPKDCSAVRAEDNYTWGNYQNLGHVYGWSHPYTVEAKGVWQDAYHERKAAGC